MPGGIVSGDILVAGTLALAGTPEAPIVVTGLVNAVDGVVTIESANFVDGGRLAVAGADRRGQVDVSRSTFTVAEGYSAFLLAGSFRADVVDSTFSGAGTAVRADFGAARSSLSVSDSRFLGPGTGIEASMLAPSGRLSLSGNTFEGIATDLAGFTGQLGLVAIRGTREISAPAIVTLSDNTFLGGTVGLSIEAASYRLLSTGDTFRGNAAGVLIGNSGRNAVFDRTTFEGTLRYDLVIPSSGDATVKDPLSFSPGKVYVTQGSTVTLEDGKSRTAITYDWMMQNRAASASAGVGLAILGLSFSAAFRSMLVKMLFVPFYARLSPEDVLNHEKRQEILAFVRDNPGVHLRRIGHSLTISYGTLTYHLYRLEREGYVTYAQEGLFKRYYSTAGRAKEAAKERPMPTALRDLERQIYETILANPGSAQSHLAQKLGLSRQALHYHIKKLEKAGFIAKVPQGRETLIYASQTPTTPAEPEPANT